MTDDPTATSASSISGRLGVILVTAIAALPVLSILYLVLRYAVSIPLLDDWEMVPIVTSAREGTLRFAQLFEQQQEARTFFPKLFFLLFSVGKWDSRIPMMFSLLICCLTSLGLHRLLRLSGLSRAGRALTLLLIVVLIFSPTEHELWLLASGFPSFVPALCVVWGLCAVRSCLPLTTKFWLCVALAVFSSFTLANGLLIWGLTFPAVFAVETQRPPLRWLGWWMMAAATCGLIYFWNFHPNADLPRFAPATSFLDYSKYLAAFLGSGLGRSGNDYPLTASIAVGTVVLLGYIVALARTVIKWRDRAYCARVVPWLAIAAFAVGSGILAALGRIEWGVAQALESRYIAFSLYAMVGVLAIAAISSKDIAREVRSQGGRKALVTGSALAAGVFLVLYARSAAGSVPVFALRSAAARMGQGAVLFSQVQDTSKTIRAANYPRPEFVRANADALDRHHMLRPGLIRTSRISELRHVEADLAVGWLDGLTVKDQTAFAWGWAVLPGKTRPADCAVLAYEDERGEWITFAVSNAVMSRPDVAGVLHDAEQLWSGWRAEFSLTAVPKGAKLSAWGLDAKSAKLYRLKTKEPSPSL